MTSPVCAYGSITIGGKVHIGLLPLGAEPGDALICACRQDKTLLSHLVEFATDQRRIADQDSFERMVRAGIHPKLLCRHSRCFGEAFFLAYWNHYRTTKG